MVIKYSFFLLEEENLILKKNHQRPINLNRNKRKSLFFPRVISQELLSNPRGGLGLGLLGQFPSSFVVIP